MYRHILVSGSSCDQLGEQLVKAAQKGDIDEVEKLIKSGANVDFVNSFVSPACRAGLYRCVIVGCIRSLGVYGPNEVDVSRIR
jgi:hypothetical protein